MFDVTGFDGLQTVIGVAKELNKSVIIAHGKYITSITIFQCLILKGIIFLPTDLTNTTRKVG